MARNLYIISPNLYLIVQQESKREVGLNKRSQIYYVKIKDSSHGQCDNGSQEI